MQLVNTLAGFGMNNPNYVIDMKNKTNNVMMSQKIR